MNKKNKLTLEIASIFWIIWLLGIFWHPFGKPRLAWHIIVFGTGLLIAVIGLLSKEDNIEEENKEEKNGK